MASSIPHIKLEALDAFTVVGLIGTTSKANEQKKNTIAALFGEFAKRAGEVRSQTSTSMVSMNLYPDGYSGAVTESFDVIVGYRVSEAGDVPPGMTVRSFPANEYAVVTHKGSLRHLLDTYGYFHSQWLPASGHDYGDRYDLQVYTPRFLGPDHPESELDIHIPVRPAAKPAIVHPESPVRGRVEGIFIPVRNIQAAKSWYSKLLGLPEKEETALGHLYVLSGTGLILDEMPMWGGQNPEGPPTYQTPAFMLPARDIHEAYRFLGSLGAELATDIMDGHWFAFRDPDGNLLMICRSAE